MVENGRQTLGENGAFRSNHDDVMRWMPPTTNSGLRRPIETSTLLSRARDFRTQTMTDQDVRSPELYERFLSAQNHRLLAVNGVSHLSSQNGYQSFNSKAPPLRKRIPDTFESNTEEGQVSVVSIRNRLALDSKWASFFASLPRGQLGFDQSLAFAMPGGLSSVRDAAQSTLFSQSGRETERSMSHNGIFERGLLNAGVAREHSVDHNDSVTLLADLVHQSRSLKTHLELHYGDGQSVRPTSLASLNELRDRAAQNIGIIEKKQQHCGFDMTSDTTSVCSDQVSCGRQHAMSATNYVVKYSPHERKQRVQRYLEKRAKRNFAKKVHYEARKKIAEHRPRVKGRFVKRDERGENDEDSKKEKQENASEEE